MIMLENAQHRRVRIPGVMKHENVLQPWRHLSNTHSVIFHGLLQTRIQNLLAKEPRGRKRHRGEAGIYCLGATAIAPMASAVARTYNGALCTMPQWGPGAKPLLRRSGDEAPRKLKAIEKWSEQYIALWIWPFDRLGYFRYSHYIRP